MIREGCGCIAPRTDVMVWLSSIRLGGRVAGEGGYKWFCC